MLIQQSRIRPEVIVGTILEKEYAFWEHFSNFQIKRFTKLKESAVSSTEKEMYNALLLAFTQISTDLAERTKWESCSFNITEMAIPEFKKGLEPFKKYIQAEIMKAKDKDGVLNNIMEWIEINKKVDFYKGY